MSFFGLNVAVRGLFTAQRSLDVVNHNLNNINTPGYSRQQAVQRAASPVGLYDGTGMLGTGSEIIGITRMRDEYTDYKYWSENITYGEWMAKKEVLADIEVTFNEPSNSGFNKVLDGFYSALHELAKDPSSLAVRAIVREKGITVAKYFNNVAAHFEKLQADVNYRVMTKVGEVNTLAEQVQKLNKQIYTAELNGHVANDLRDQRTVLVDRLSKIVNIDVQEVTVGKMANGLDDKHFNITIGGKHLVQHFNVSKLAAIARPEKLNDEDVPNLYQVRWEDGNKLNLKGGELKGYIDMRDGNAGENGSPQYSGIPYYMRKLDEFVRVFAKAFNEGFIGSDDMPGHADGYGLDPDGEGSLTAAAGIRFFTMIGENGKPINSMEFLNGASSRDEIEDRYKQITARNFYISTEIINDLHAIAASSNADERGNSIVMNELIKQRHNVHMFQEGAPEDFMKSLVSNLGIDTQQAIRFAENQTIIVAQIENRRLSESGVSIDEEMANLVKFQQAYHASAKMIQTMQEVYEILLNKIGI